MFMEMGDLGNPVGDKFPQDPANLDKVLPGFPHVVGYPRLMDMS